MKIYPELTANNISFVPQAPPPPPGSIFRLKVHTRLNFDNKANDHSTIRSISLPPLPTVRLYPSLISHFLKTDNLLYAPNKWPQLNFQTFLEYTFKTWISRQLPILTLAEAPKYCRRYQRCTVSYIYFSLETIDSCLLTLEKKIRKFITHTSFFGFSFLQLGIYFIYFPFFIIFPPFSFPFNISLFLHRLSADISGTLLFVSPAWLQLADRRLTLGQLLLQGRRLPLRRQRTLVRPLQVCQRTELTSLAIFNYNQGWAKYSYST